MDTKQKTRAGLAGGLAALALVIGGASIASGDPTTASPSTATPAAPAATQDDHHGDHPCPKDGDGGGGSGAPQQQAAPSGSSPSTTTPSL